MFDPESVETYKLFHCDLRDILPTFKLGTIDSIFSTIPVIRNDDDSVDENTTLHKLYYKLLADSGSLFANPSLNIYMESMGWIKQHDVMTKHYTKSDNFYREFHDSPICNVEDYAKARKITNNIEINGVDDFHDMVCNFYTLLCGITMDPTMCNGPHIISALQRGRRSIGIERDVRWYDMSENA